MATRMTHQQREDLIKCAAKAFQEVLSTFGAHLKLSVICIHNDEGLGKNWISSEGGEEELFQVVSTYLQSLEAKAKGQES